MVARSSRRALLTVLVLAAAIVPVAGAGSSLPVLGDCLGNRLVRPPSISLCDQGNSYLIDMEWTKWAARHAAAAGLARQDDCVPFCAGGTFHSYPVTVELYRPKRCSGGHLEFTRLSYSYTGKRPAGLSAGPHVLTVPLGGSVNCP